jgi:hypothetical protein
MTGYQPNADASDELCPYLTDAGGVMPGSSADASDKLCPHLTEPDGVTTDSRTQFVGAHRTEGVMPGSPPGARATLTGATPWVRPYVLTGGRTRAHHDLLVHTLVSVPDYNPSLAAQLPPEARSLYERAHTHTESVAELSAHCGMPLGVTRVLLSDLAATGHVLIGPDPYTSPYDCDLLERIIDGLQQFV